MLDVHPPHEKIHGFGDFLLHLLTITIGLLIAVGIEGCVESAHHRHQRREAEANLRQEIRGNQQQLGETRAVIPKERENLAPILKLLQAKSMGKPTDLKSFTVRFRPGLLADASWRTASATGVLSYMEYERVQRYAAAYQEQGEFVRVQANTLDEFLQLLSFFAGDFDPAKITPEEARTQANDVRRALAHLQALDQIGEGLGKTYEKALAP